MEYEGRLIVGAIALAVGGRCNPSFRDHSMGRSSTPARRSLWKYRQEKFQWTNAPMSWMLVMVPKRDGQAEQMGNRIQLR